MTDVDTRPISPSRHGQPWTEQDFAAIAQACREGHSLEVIAQRIGRSPTGLRGQLRRMLPVDERHLSADLALPRLHQLCRDDDYDWLAAMAERERPQWLIEQEAHERARSDALEMARVVGIGALPDEQVAALALAALYSPDALPPELADLLSREIVARGLATGIATRALRHLRESFSSVLQLDPVAYGWAGLVGDIDGAYDPWGERWRHGDTTDPYSGYAC